MFGRLGVAFAALAILATQARALDCKSDRLGQSELNICAGQAFEAADAALNARYKKIVGCLKDEARPLVEAQRAWIAYRDAECRFQGDGSAGGSIHPMVVAGCLRQVTEARVKALDYYLTCEEGDMACPTSSCGFRKSGTSP